MQAREPELIEKLAGIYPVLRQKRRRGWIYAVALAICSVFLAVAAPTLFSSKDEMVPLMWLGGGVIGVLLVNRWVRRSQQRLVMPLLAQTVDLEYQQKATEFLNNIPRRLLPRASVQMAEDHLSGKVGGRSFQMAEVKFKTGGKRSRTLFEGFVLRFENVAPVPAFFIAQAHKTDGWFSRMDTSGLVESHKIRGQNNIIYGVWLSEVGMAKKDPALNAVIDILTDLEAQIEGHVRLFSATSTGEEMHIALDHSSDLYRIGGLMANDEAIMDGIKKASEQLNIPLQIVSTLLEAERQAGQVSEV